MLVVCGYYRGDVEQAERLAKRIDELGDLSGHNLLVARDRGTTARPFAHLGFDRIDEIEIIDAPLREWPFPANNVFQKCAKHIYNNVVGSPRWLWLEPDVWPMCPGWLATVEAEDQVALAAGKIFLGDFVSVHTPELDVPDHMSGVGVYPANLVDLDRQGDIMLCDSIAWDVSGAHIIVPRMHKSEVIHHSWKHKAFVDQEQVQREIYDFKPNCVLFHADKTGSLSKLLSGESSDASVARAASGSNAPPAQFLSKGKEAVKPAETEVIISASVPVSPVSFCSGDFAGSNPAPCDPNYENMQQVQPIPGATTHPGQISKLSTMPDLRKSTHIGMEEAQRLEQDKAKSATMGADVTGMDGQSRKGKEADDLREMRGAQSTSSSSPRLQQTPDGEVAVSNVPQIGTSFICDILIKSYPADYPLLDYCVKSLGKFASGFRRLIIVHPEADPPNGAVLNKPEGMELELIPVRENGDGYLWQQCIKINAHEYTDAKYILHTDSDTFFTCPITPATFFRDGKPFWLMTPYAKIKAPWQASTEKFMGEPVEYELMRRMPVFVPREIHVITAAFCLIKHRITLKEYIMSQPAREFSEFNVLGAVAYSQSRNDFTWIDTHAE